MACAKNVVIIGALVLAITLVVVLCFTYITRSRRPLVRVEQGDLEGSVVTYDEDKSFYSFKGIPYAQPPVGELRFQPPKPPLNWNGVRDAMKHGNFCIQYDSRIDQILYGSEDCLYLNVYTKNFKPSNLLPVLFWIHGGAFASGSGDIINFDPRFFLEVDDIVVVTFNYRLEVLGFLSLGTPEIPGNIGLKDQLAALQWVNRNIENLGGDKNNITIAACSSGAALATIHMLSPKTKGLFQKAIIMSGTALNSWGVEYAVEKRSWQLLKHLGYNGSDSREALNFLKSVPADKLVKITMPPIMGEIEELFLFAPVVEKDFGDGSGFLIDKPEVILEEMRASAVPLMIGSVSGEGIGMAHITYFVDKAKTQPSYFTPNQLKQNSLISDNDLGLIVKNFYFGDKEFTNETFQNFIDATGDVYFVHDVQMFARKMSNIAPVYYYEFHYENNRNMLKFWYNMTMYRGVCHGDDVFYAFHTTLDPSIPKPSPEAKEFIRSYLTLWTNFMKTGNPTPSNQQPMLEWKRFTESERNYLIIDQPMITAINPLQDRMLFWDELYRLYGKSKR